MASKSLGTLTLDLIANTSSFTSGMDKAGRDAEKRAKEIEKAFDNAAKGIGVAFGAMSAGALAGFAAFDQATKYVADFQDLAESTGASAEGIASFAVAAGTAGVSLESVGTSMVRLTKNLTGVDDESKAAGAALKFLNIDIKEFKDLSPEDQYEQVAKALGEVASKTDQVAVAMDLWGKAGAEQLKVVNALNEQGGRQVILTGEMIAQADAYADAQSKAAAELKIYAGYIASLALPAVTDLMKAFSDMAKEIIDVDKSAKDLKSSGAVESWAESAISAVGFVVDAFNGLKTVVSRTGEFIGATMAATVQLVKGNLEGVRAIQSAYGQSLDTSQFQSFSDRLKKVREERKAMERLAAQENRGFTPGANPGRTYGGATTGGGKKSAGKDPFAEATRYIESLEKQLEKTQELTVAEQALQDIQLGRLGKVTTAQKERILNLAAEVDAAKKLKEQEKDDKKYQESIQKLNEQMEQYSGNLAKAAAIKFDRDNAEVIAQAMKRGDVATQGLIKSLRDAQVAAGGLAEAQKDFSKSQTDMQRSEERLARDQELGIVGQLDGLVKLGEVRKTALEGMKQSYSELEQLQASGITFTEEQTRAMEALKYEIDDLSTRLDPLAEKFNNDFANGAADAFMSIIDGSKSAKEAVTDMVTSIINDLVKMAAQDVFKSLFSGGGSATGGVGFDFGSLLSAAFGGARAMGGPVLPNSLYQVNERGPEIFQAANGSQYLMTGTNSGKVLPSSGGPTINVNVQGIVSRDTPGQIANQVSLQQRNGRRYA